MYKFNFNIITAYLLPNSTAAHKYIAIMQLTSRSHSSLVKSWSALLICVYYFVVLLGFATITVVNAEKYTRTATYNDQVLVRW